MCSFSGRKSDKIKREDNLALRDQIQNSDQKLSDFKLEIPKLNECCMFCNNRLVIEAVKTNNLNMLKKLLNDNDNITNPFQALFYADPDYTALKLAC